MELLRIDHYTLVVPPVDLPVLRDFYTRVLGLTEGPRPDFDFPGHWLYGGGAPLVHLAGIERAPAGGTSDASSGATSSRGTLAPLPTGRFDHISFRSRGLARTRSHLRAHGIEWREAPVPGFPLHQIFMRDPAGVKVELTFDAAELDETDARD